MVADAVLVHELLEGLELMVSPPRIAEVLVEYDDGARLQSRREGLEHDLGR